MVIYCKSYQQVASGAAVSARLAHARDPDAGAIVHTARDGNLERFSDLLEALAAALRALVTDDLAGTAAVRTCLDISDHAEKGLLGIGDLTGTAALRTLLRLGTRLCAAAVTIFTFFLISDLDVFLNAEDSIHEADPHVDPDIGPLHGSVVAASCAAAAAAEEVAEDIAEDITHVAAEIETAKAASSAAALFEGCVAELVILASLIRIRQDRIGFGGLLELGLGILVSRIDIRVILLGQLPVGLLQVCFRRVSGNTEDLIIISFIFCHYVKIPLIMNLMNIA